MKENWERFKQFLTRKTIEQDISREHWFWREKQQVLHLLESRFRILHHQGIDLQGFAGGINSFRFLHSREGQEVRKLDTLKVDSAALPQIETGLIQVYEGQKQAAEDMKKAVKALIPGEKRKPVVTTLYEIEEYLRKLYTLSKTSVFVAREVKEKKVRRSA
jgi:hypothetical protein